MQVEGCRLKGRRDKGTQGSRGRGARSSRSLTVASRVPQQPRGLPMKSGQVPPAARFVDLSPVPGLLDLGVTIIPTADAVG